MGRWLYVLGGLLIWALHFSGLYAIASIDAVTPANDQALWRMVGFAFTGACILGTLAILWRAARGRGQAEPAALLNWLAAFGAGSTAVAIAWQGLVLLLTRP